MFFNKGIKWTIDADNSEISFRIKYLALRLMNNTIDKTRTRPRICESNLDQHLSKEFSEAFHKRCDTWKESFVAVEEWPATTNYNLVIFEDKNPKQFWQRRTFSGMLIFKNTGKNRLITLRHITNTFDNCGRVAANYSVSGKLNKIDFDLDMSSIENEGMIVLSSELLFEGTVRLVQEE